MSSTNLSLVHAWRPRVFGHRRQRSRSVAHSSRPDHVFLLIAFFAKWRLMLPVDRARFQLPPVVPAAPFSARPCCHARAADAPMPELFQMCRLLVARLSLEVVVRGVQTQRGLR